MGSSDEILSGAIRTAIRRTSVLARYPTLCDVAAAVFLALASFIGLAVHGRLHDTDTIVFCVLWVLPLPLRTIDRRLSFSLIAAVAFAQWLTSTPQIANASILVSFFWIALDGEVAEVAIAAAIVELGAVLAALRCSPADPLKVLVGISGLGVASGALGLLMRERRQLVASLQERAARLELERDQEGRLGGLAER